MGYNLILVGSEQGDHETDLCTDGGYASLCEWIGGLDAKTYPALRAFADRGEYRPTVELADQLLVALADDAPDDPDTYHVADRLADLLGGGYPGETASVDS